MNRVHITQFAGESNWDAVINDFSLDIVEEQSFEDFCLTRGIPMQSTLHVLQGAFEDWTWVNQCGKE